MVLTDKNIKEYRDKLVSPFNPEQVQNICYDLMPETFCNDPGKELDSITLLPGDSVFVKSKERIILPDNIMGIVSLRNSRIRQGFSLDAPIYQPGHDTKVFFRITNISRQSITLDCTFGIASILFIVLSSDVEKPYNGTFQSEFEFRGMGRYTSAFSKEMTDIEQKIDQIKEIEKTIYSNILALMAIFVAIFSLVNVNVSLAVQNVSTKMLLTMNFATVASIGFLIAIINTILSSGKYRRWIWFSCFAAFALTILIQFIL